MGAETETIVAESATPIGAADLLIALPACRSGEALEVALARLPGVLPPRGAAGKIIILHPDGAMGAEAIGAPRTLAASVEVQPFPLLPVDRYGEQSQADALESVLAASQKMNARACLVLSSDLSAMTKDDLLLLIQPILEQSFDLVIPNYTEYRFEGLINRGVVRPLARALYGQRLRYPMAPDFAFSANLAEKFALMENSTAHPLNWITTAAVCAGLKTCEANVAFGPPAREGAELSSVLAEVLASLFTEMDYNAGFWQRIRGSHSLPASGEPSTLANHFGGVDGGPVDVEKMDVQKMDVQKMIDAFQRGLRDLFEIWSIVLPPATLLDLKKLAKMPADSFRMPDSVWVRLLYDFALGFRQRVMTRDHLLRSFTPAYLAWVASYALEVQSATANEVENRLERLYLTFESSKPYLLSRWRWPDRFNP